MSACLAVFTSQEVPSYPGGQEQISTADALLSPPAEGFATCIENEWSLHTSTRHGHGRTHTHKHTEMSGVNMWHIGSLSIFTVKHTTSLTQMGLFG